MLKHIPVLIILLFAFVLSSCTDDGELKVNNQTSGVLQITVAGQTAELDAQQSFSKKWELSKTIFSAEEKEVAISGEGLFKREFETTVKVKAGEKKTVNIDPDAGVIRVENLSSSTNINEIYLSPSSEQYWGSNALSGFLPPNYYIMWRVSPGDWDVKIVDENNQEYYAYQQTVYVDQMLVLRYNPSEQSHFAPAQDRKASGGRINTTVNKLESRPIRALR